MERVKSLKNIVYLLLLPFLCNGQVLEIGLINEPVYNFSNGLVQNLTPMINAELKTDDLKLYFSFNQERLNIGAYLGNELEIGAFYTKHNEADKIKLSVRYILLSNDSYNIKVGSSLEVPIMDGGQYRLSPFFIQFSKSLSNE